MVSVFNIEPIDMEKKRVINDYPYNFLNVISENYNIDITNYYNLLNSIEVFKLKNIYHYIFLRLNKINNIYKKIDKLPKKKGKLKGDEFNDIIRDYIKTDIIN